MQADGIIRFADLTPSWHVKQAKEPGYLRWLVNWVGGPRGYVNSNPGIAAESHNYVLGLMHMPAGNRQAGLHTHSVTEIYVVLQGWFESIDGAGTRHRAGPLDCLSIPPGVPHGVRTLGTEDLRLVWLHDRIERSGTSVYHDGDAIPGQTDEITLVRFNDLEAAWTGVRAQEAGYLHWGASWVGRRAAMSGSNARLAAENAHVDLGLTVLLPGNTLILPQADQPRTILVLHGQAMADTGEGAQELAPLDALHGGAGNALTLRNPGDTPAQLLTVRGLDT